MSIITDKYIGSLENVITFQEKYNNGQDDYIKILNEQIIHLEKIIVHKDKIITSKNKTIKHLCSL